MKFTLIIAFVLVSMSVFASSDTVIVNKDPRLDAFAQKQAYVNKLSGKLTSTGKFKGYRLQVLVTRSREEALSTKTMLMQRYPDQKGYLMYQSPSFKLRFGNFPDRKSAEDFKKELSTFYKQSIYVVEDLIDYIPKDEDLNDD